MKGGKSGVRGGKVLFEFTKISAVESCSLLA